jgi:aspartyl protease family protein
VRRLLWLLLAVLAVVLVFFIARHDGAMASLAPIGDPSLVTKSVMAIVAGVLLIGLFRENWLRTLESAVIWVVIAALLAVGYTYRFELRDVGNRVLSELVPGYVVARGRTVEISRSPGGNFVVAIDLNGASITTILDTGASSVVLTQEAAKAAGLPLEVLTYTVAVDTANGRTRAAPVTLDRIAVGGIIERAVPALVAQPGQLRTNLLGMSFLNRLESWEVRGDRLVMRGYP